MNRAPSTTPFSTEKSAGECWLAVGLLMHGVTTFTLHQLKSHQARGAQPPIRPIYASFRISYLEQSFCIIRLYERYECLIFGLELNALLYTE